MVPRACADSSGMDSFMASAGAARIKMTAADSTVAKTGCPCTTRAHRSAGCIFLSAERTGLRAPSTTMLPGAPPPDTLLPGAPPPDTVLPGAPPPDTLLPGAPPPDTLLPGAPPPDTLL